MGNLSTIIPLTREEIEIYIHYDFGYFMEKAFDNFNVSIGDREIARQKYEESKSQLEFDIKKNKKQTLLLVEGNVRKMHSGVDNGWVLRLEDELLKDNTYSIFRFDGKPELKDEMEMLWKELMGQTIKDPIPDERRIKLAKTIFDNVLELFAKEGETNYKRKPKTYTIAEFIEFPYQYFLPNGF